MKGRATVSVLAVLLAAIAAHALGVEGDGGPSLSSTYPTLLVLPAFMGVPPILIAVVYGACFALWCKQLFAGRAEIPRRSVVLFAGSFLLSIAIFVGGWRYGLKYQGTSYVYWCLLLSIGCTIALVSLLIWNWCSPRVATSVLFHFVLFGWVCTYAMPYLGETP